MCLALASMCLQPVSTLWALDGGAAAKAVTEEEDVEALGKHTLATMKETNFLTPELRAALIEWGWQADFSEKAFYAAFRGASFEEALFLGFDTDQGHSRHASGGEANDPRRIGSRDPNFAHVWWYVVLDMLQVEMLKHSALPALRQKTAVQQNELFEVFLRAFQPVAEVCFGEVGAQPADYVKAVMRYRLTFA